MKWSHPTGLPDLVLIEPVVHEDHRGFLIETWQSDRYREAGLPGPFVLDVHSHSRAGVLRGLHFQYPDPQGKLVRVTRGRVFDVAVDVRVGSPAFGRWWGTELSGTNHRQLWIPPGFAHGFAALEASDVQYRCTESYTPRHARGFRWDDPALGIEWPLEEPVLSATDAEAPTLAELERAGLLPRYDE